MGCLSSTSGFRSIISTWLWRKVRTVSRLIPAGSGLMVVKTVCFDIICDYVVPIGKLGIEKVDDRRFGRQCSRDA